MPGGVDMMMHGWMSPHLAVIFSNSFPLQAIHQLPRLELQGSVQPITRSTLRVELTITPDFQFDAAVHGNAEPFHVFVEDVDSEIILHSEYFLLRKKFAQTEHVLSFTIPIFDPLPPQYFVRVVSDRWLGSEVVLPMSFRHLILPEKFAPPTELLDLQPISTNEIASEKWINFFERKFSVFNPIQTQVFSAVYKKNDSLLVAAPVGSGKTAIAELAIIRQLIAQPKDSKIVYIAPLASIAEEKYKEWTNTFEKQYGVSVALLPGETGADLKLLSSATLIIATPEQWDVLSRRWKTRKPIQDVNLLIVDELELIAGRTGPTIEIIVSRMRYMTSQLKTHLRIIGLSASVANAKDLGEWLGCSANAIFNFHPASRPVPLEIRVQGFDLTDFHARTIAMVKPAYSAINSLSPTKPVFVFVPNKKFAKSTALDFMTFAVGEDQPDRFLRGITREALREKLKKLQNATLLETLCAGIGFLHENMAVEERALVESLYKANHISILVIEYALCWGLNLFSHLTIVLGCQQYDSSQHRYVDLSINDITAMVGLSCRPNVDAKSLAVIYCVSSKKSFYSKFLYQPAPVESYLDSHLADSLLAEIITKRITTVQDAVDYLTWSFLYRRLTQNPNFYGLAGTTHRHFSDHLSELIENTLEDLQQAKMIALEDETELSPLNLGMIATYYYIHYTTVEIFSRSLQKKTKLKGLLEIISSASEFDDIPVRPKEEEALRKLSRHLPLIISEGDNFEDAHTKSQILLQAHFSRIPLSNTVARDLTTILPIATRLLQAMVDVLSSNGWLSPALACMELSQMLTQGLWNNESVLLQLPHFTKELAQKCADAGVKTIADLMELEDEDRDALLKFTPSQLVAVAQVCNAYPDIDVSYHVHSADDLHAGAKATLEVRLLRDPDDDDAPAAAGVPLVTSTRYPGSKTEGWWLVLGNMETNELVSIKRVAMATREMKLQMEFTPPKEGNVKYMVRTTAHMGRACRLSRCVCMSRMDVLTDVFCSSRLCSCIS
jgi:pre-mRNA-splicing helicase BRR2